MAPADVFTSCRAVASPGGRACWSSNPRRTLSSLVLLLTQVSCTSQTMDQPLSSSKITMAIRAQMKQQHIEWHAAAFYIMQPPCGLHGMVHHPATLQRLLLCTCFAQTILVVICFGTTVHTGCVCTYHGMLLLQGLGL